MAKKRSLSKNEEFEIMKIVVSKVMLFALFVLGLGFYRLVSNIGTFGFNLLVMLSGIILLVLFTAVLSKEYEYIQL